MEIEREDLMKSLGGEAAVAKMSHEARADALEEFQIAKLDAEVAAKRQTKKFPTVAEHETLVDTRGYRRGIGKIFRQARHTGGHFSDPNAPRTVACLPKMPEKPTLFDFFEYRFAPATHLLQSAALAKRKGCSEEVVIACLLHDIGGTLMKADHGYWGAQLIEPYVSEKVAFAVRYHQALRFFPDAETGYEYPVRYYEAFGVDYVPPSHIQAAYEYARNHKWYTEARLVTTNDLYAFNKDITVHVDEFRDIIGRHFKGPDEGLGYDNSPVAHMWRTMINPDAPL